MWWEAPMHAIERSRALDRAGRTASRLFHRAVRPGPIKDALSGTWMGHPVHPVLTDVPIGAWTSAMALDAVGGKAAERGARALVGLGVLSAIPTALTGLNDLTDIVDERERSTGAAHAIGNTIAVGLFALSYLRRGRGKGRLLSALAMAVATGGAYLGGHLVYHKGVGVDTTAFEDDIDDWTPVLDDAEPAEGKAKRARAGNAEIMVARSDGLLHAIANRCSHRGGPLFKGRIEDGCVTCPWHRSRFRLADGSIARGPATAPQKVYDTRVRDGRIEIRLRGRSERL